MRIKVKDIDVGATVTLPHCGCLAYRSNGDEQRVVLSVRHVCDGRASSKRHVWLQCVEPNYEVECDPLAASLEAAFE